MVSLDVWPWGLMCATVVIGVVGIRDGGLPVLAWPGGALFRWDAAAGQPGYLLLAVEVALLALTVALAWRSRRSWPVAAAMLQGFGMAALLALLFDPRIEAAHVHRLSVLTTLAAVALLLAGLARGALRR